MEKGAGIEFCADYITLLNYQLKDFKKNPDLPEVLIAFLEENNYQWSRTISTLLQSLTNFKALQHYEGIELKIPSTSSRLSREINNLKVELETTGIIVEMRKTRNNSRFIQLVIEKNEE